MRHCCFLEVLDLGSAIGGIVAHNINIFSFIQLPIICFSVQGKPKRPREWRRNGCGLRVPQAGVPGRMTERNAGTQYGISIWDTGGISIDQVQEMPHAAGGRNGEHNNWRKWVYVLRVYAFAHRSGTWCSEPFCFNGDRWKALCRAVWGKAFPWNRLNGERERAKCSD